MTKINDSVSNQLLLVGGIDHRRTLAPISSDTKGAERQAATVIRFVDASTLAVREAALRHVRKSGVF